MPGFNAIAWFEIGTDNPAAAERFYGDVLGWTVAHDGNPGYEVFTTGDAEGVQGGLFDAEGKLPSYAVFSVLVSDVAETCRRVQAAGGSVKRAPQVTPGGITFAHLLDPAGHHFEVFTMPPGRDNDGRSAQRRLPVSSGVAPELVRRDVQVLAAQLARRRGHLRGDRRPRRSGRCGTRGPRRAAGTRPAGTSARPCRRTRAARCRGG